MFRNKKATIATVSSAISVIAAVTLSSSSSRLFVANAFRPPYPSASFHPVAGSSSTILQQEHHGISKNNMMEMQQQKRRRPALTVLYRIRCENKYYQLEELEDADNCTTELFLKENGVVEIGETDGPLFENAVGNWNVIENKFAMSITKTFVSGNEKNDMGEFIFDVERVFEGDMTVVGGTEVAVNGKIFAEDVVTSKLEKEVGFFNMIDSTDVKLDKCDDFDGISGEKKKDLGVEPTPIDSKDVRGHDGIPKEWGITADQLKSVSQQVVTAPSQPPRSSATTTASSLSYEQQLSQQYGSQQQSPPPPTTPAYGQQQQQNFGGSSGQYGQQQQQQPQGGVGLPQYGDATNFGQQTQGYGGEGGGNNLTTGRQQQQQQQGGGFPEYGAGNFGQDSQAYGGGGGGGNPPSYGADAAGGGGGYGQQQQGYQYGSSGVVGGGGSNEEYYEQQQQQQDANDQTNNDDEGYYNYDDQNVNENGGQGGGGLNTMDFSGSNPWP